MKTTESNTRASIPQNADPTNGFGSVDLDASGNLVRMTFGPARGNANLPEVEKWRTRRWQEMYNNGFSRRALSRSYRQRLWIRMDKARNSEGVSG